MAASLTGTDLDNYDIVPLTLKRVKGESTLGLSLTSTTNKPNRSLSRASVSSAKSSKSTKSKKSKQSDEVLPIITHIEPDSPADRCGLLVDDIILEVNGNKTNGQSTKTIGKWINQSGNEIEFIVIRAKKSDLNTLTEAQIKENARQIAEDAKLKLASDSFQRDVEINISQRLSRRESAALPTRSQTQLSSQPGSPKVLHSEIRMSSSRLHQESPKPAQQIDDSPHVLHRVRNQSEPDLNASFEKNGATLTPVSRRSASSFTIPRDAPVPRLCRVRAYEEQLGFTVAGSKSNKGVFKVNDVTPNSPAAHSGLLNDDYIIEISGRNVEAMNYNEVVAYIKSKKADDDLQLLVADRSTLSWYKSKKIQISSQVVPKMQYIETLLNEELHLDANFNSDS